MDKERRVAELQRQIDAIQSYEEPIDHCAVCHRTLDEVEFEMLTDVTVIVADGEEGYSNVTLLLCYEHLDPVAEALCKLGFIDHRHGSTSTLEDQNCPGHKRMEDCPTPTRYGNVTWDRRPPQDLDPDEV